MQIKLISRQSEKKRIGLNIVIFQNTCFRAFISSIDVLFERHYWTLTLTFSVDTRESFFFG